MAVPEERLNAIIQLQEVLIDLLQQYYIDHSPERLRDLIRYTLRRLEGAQERLMQANVVLTEVKKEIELAVERLEWHINQNITEKKNLEWAQNLLKKIIICQSLFK